MLAGVLLLAATGCSKNDIPRFGFPKPITPQGVRVLALWQGSVIAALVVGVFVWGLIFWCVFAYRKNSDELPRQVRYNLPIEILYTAIPLVIIGVLFFYTAVIENYEDKDTPHPGLTIGVIGYKWNWQFNYASVIARACRSTAARASRPSSSCRPTRRSASSSPRPTSSTRSGSRPSCSSVTSSLAVPTSSS